MIHPATEAGRAAFLMVVGPGEGLLAVDTLDSIAVFEPEAAVWLLDDCTRDGTYEIVQNWAATHPGCHLERNPAPRGYRGIARSFFSLLSAVAAEPMIPELVIKLDPDTCLIAPGVIDLMRQRMAAGGGPGIVGAYRIAANGQPRVFASLRRNMLLDTLPVGLHEDRRSLRLGRPFWTRYVALARQHGYQLGEHVLGALSAMHGDTVRAIRDSGFLDGLPPHYRALTVEEDVLLGLGAKAVGHRLIDINVDPAHPDVWIQFRPPVPIDAGQLLRSGVRAVHPVKATADGEAMRRVFRGRRALQQPEFDVSQRQC